MSTATSEALLMSSVTVKRASLSGGTVSTATSPAPTMVSRWAWAGLSMASGSTMHAATTTAMVAAARFRLRWRNEGSRMAIRRLSSCEGRAMASDATCGHLAECSERAVSSKISAYVEACVPANSTMSSAARSRSMRDWRAATHASGLNQWTAQATCVNSCIRQSRRRTCASSWSNTVRRCCASHIFATSGKMTAGRHTPTLNGTAVHALQRSRTGRRIPSRLATSPAS